MPAVDEIAFASSVTTQTSTARSKFGDAAIGFATASARVPLVRTGTSSTKWPKRLRAALADVARTTRLSSARSIDRPSAAAPARPSAAKPDAEDARPLAVGKEFSDSTRAEVVTPAGHPFTVWVDYAHTPDGLENVLAAARELGPKRVIVVFGCGGDRDRTKRPMMGEVAGRLADLSVVTSDNPRSEDPNAIIAEILPGIRGEHRVVPDRAEAIAAALAAAQPGDLVVIAGKGHEDYQIFADRTIHFDDREVAREALAAT